MGRPKSPISLQEGCIDNVVNNIEKWCNLYTEKYGANKLDHHDVDGPFNSLPSTFLEEIIYILGKKDLLKRHHLEFLVTPKLKTLNLNHCCFELEDTTRSFLGFLHLGSIRCPNLEVLIVQNVNYWRSISFLQMYIPMFQKLQELHISYTNTGDSCLQVLGAYCKELRVLNAEGCSAVTDVGIKGLCAAFDELGREIQTLGQCKSIHSLYILNTGVTQKGIQLAIENLPALKIFQFNYYVLILAQLHKECNFPNYQLISQLNAECYLYDPHLPYKSGSLLRLATFFSSLNEVTITPLAGISDQELLGLLQLRSLCELHIVQEESNDREITFDGGVVPLLKAFGNSLIALEIIGAVDFRVNIRAIVEYCPKLEFLNLEDSGDYITAPLDEEQNSMKRVRKNLILENLKVLRLECDRQGKYDISSEGLNMFLSSPELVEVSLNGCRTLDDGIFRNAFDLHQFQNLEILEIGYNHSVTQQSIYLLVNENNPLESLTFSYCKHFTFDFVDKLEGLARQNNWNLSIRCYSDPRYDDL